MTKMPLTELITLDFGQSFFTVELKLTTLTVNNKNYLKHLFRLKYKATFAF